MCKLSRDEIHSKRLSHIPKFPLYHPIPPFFWFYRYLQTFSFLYYWIDWSSWANQFSLVYPVTAELFTPAPLSLWFELLIHFIQSLLALVQPSSTISDTPEVELSRCCKNSTPILIIVLVPPIFIFSCTSEQVIPSPQRLAIPLSDTSELLASGISKNLDIE